MFSKNIGIKIFILIFLSSTILYSNDSVSNQIETAVFLDYSKTQGLEWRSDIIFNSEYKETLEFGLGSHVFYKNFFMIKTYVPFGYVKKYSKITTSVGIIFSYNYFIYGAYREWGFSPGVYVKLKLTLSPKIYFGVFSSYYTKSSGNLKSLVLLGYRL